MSILIYDGAVSGPDSVADAGNYVNLNGTPAGHAPTAADIVLYGSANYLVTNYGNVSSPTEGVPCSPPALTSSLTPRRQPTPMCSAA